jgi:hypothetical protein
VLGEVPPFASVERSDDAAAKGPWTLVVRRADGALGRHGAVITFPVPRPAWGHPVRVGNVFGRAVMAGVVWPIAGRHARIRGDLAQAELIRLALATHVVAGLPAIRPPSGYWIRLAAPYRSGSIHEIRYHASQLGGAAARLDGLIYTGLLAAGAGFEDRLYALAAGDAGMVHGRPAVAAVTVGARPTLAWEVAPGTVAYLGYSGSRPDRAVDVLRQLASQSRALCGKEWRASNPQHTQQFNDFG